MTHLECYVVLMFIALAATLYAIHSNPKKQKDSK